MAGEVLCLCRSSLDAIPPPRGLAATCVLRFTLLGVLDVEVLALVSVRGVMTATGVDGTPGEPTTPRKQGGDTWDGGDGTCAA